jgi:hypothetical protein
MSNLDLNKYKLTPPELDLAKYRVEPPQPVPKSTIGTTIADAFQGGIQTAQAGHQVLQSSVQEPYPHSAHPWLPCSLP